VQQQAVAEQQWRHHIYVQQHGRFAPRILSTQDQIHRWA
jgi:hypothetical protein